MIKVTIYYQSNHLAYHLWADLSKPDGVYGNQCKVLDDIISRLEHQGLLTEKYLRETLLTELRKEFPIEDIELTLNYEGHSGTTLLKKILKFNRRSRFERMLNA